MVKPKKNTIKTNAKKNSTQNETEGIVTNNVFNSNQTPEEVKTEVEENLKKLHSKIDLEAIKKIDFAHKAELFAKCVEISMPKDSDLQK